MEVWPGRLFASNGFARAWLAVMIRRGELDVGNVTYTFMSKALLDKF